MKKLHVIRPRSSASTSMPEPTTTRGSQYWRSLSSKRAPEAGTWREFPTDDADTLEVKGGVSRRRFFGLVGSGAALAGVTTTGCIRKPKENILPFTERPEDIIPGQAVYYATAFQLGTTVEGILVESQDGRPTKIEGNPKHSGSLGATSTLAQASVLDLYDPDRSRYPVLDGQKVEVATALAAFDEALTGTGEGVALVLPLLLSPTERSLLVDLRKRLPSARLFLDDPLAPSAAFAAAEAVGGAGARFRYSLKGAKVIFAADCNFLGGIEPDSTRLSREWSAGRKIVEPGDEMSRMYTVEPQLSNVGVMADHRMRLPSALVGDALLVLAREVGVASVPQGQVDEATHAMLVAAAGDLKAAGAGASAILVGQRQPAWVHEVALAINDALGNNGKTVVWSQDASAPVLEAMDALAEGLGSGAIKTLVALSTNPVYDGAGALGLAELIAPEKVNLLHAGLYRDETGARARVHLPLSHDLEAWGDVVSSDGTVTIRQPLIDPLHGTPSRTEVLAHLASGQDVDGYSLLKGQWMQTMGPQFSDKAWRKWLHEGVVTVPSTAEVPQLRFGAVGYDAASRKAPAGWEVNVYLDLKVADGRFANNVWLQELPEPITKLTWDNAALLSAASAKELGVETGDLLSITVDGRSVEVPAFVAPGQADHTISIALGYGRTILPHHSEGESAMASTGAGFNAYPLVAAGAGLGAWFGAGEVKATGRQYDLVTTQEYGKMRPTTGNEAVDNSDSSFGNFQERPIVLEATVDDFVADPNFVERANLMEPEALRHLWNPPDLKGDHQWGMSIDLNTCTSCNACVVACQSENNIPVVGKAEVAVGREMHWMRIDRYYRGDDNNPTAVVQPMACQHCESAPCETVCPVAATVHSPEGLNEMTYNRCIGTRYCSNNCPFKVRRFNFLQLNAGLRPSTFWNDDVDGAWLRQMQKNPDVTIRFRGVMEKCTYCVQRINQAKIAAHVDGKDILPDGAITTACQQVCPTEAIVFGNIADPNSKVSIAKRSTRDYAVLADLNIHPRTTYLARIRNSNPALPRPIPEPPLIKGPATANGHHGSDAHGEAHHEAGHGADAQPGNEHGGH